MSRSPRILVTGATGTHGGVGGHLVKSLIAGGIPVRALVRTLDERAERLAQAGAEVVKGDFLKLATLRPALEGVEQVFFCYPLAGDLLQATANLCVAAGELKVRCIVNVSILMAAEDHPSPVCRDHWLSERIFDWADVAAVHLRGGFFYENLIRFAAEGVRREERIKLPFGDGQARLAWVGGADVAAVAEKILAQPGGHAGKTYEITAGETLTIHDIARGFTQVLGRPIAYEQTPLDAWLVQIEPILAGNTQLRRHVSILSRAISGGRVVGRTTDIVERMTYRVPQNIEQFAAAHRSMFE